MNNRYMDKSLKFNPNKKQIGDLNPDIQITIQMDSTTGKTLVKINKPIPAIMVAHLMGQCMMQNLTMAVQAQSMLIDPNKIALTDSEKEPEGTIIRHDFDGDTDLCGKCGAPKIDVMHCDMV